MPNGPIQPIRPAATVIIVREADVDFEIFMLRRTSKAAFAGGMYVFPGGKVDPDDHLHRYDALRVGPSDAQATQREALGFEWRGYWIAGIRETFEEAGLLLAYDSAGQLVDYDDEALSERLAADRGPLHAGTISLADICEREGLRLAVDHIHFYNRFVTPFGRPRRFDTRFFIAAAPNSQTGKHDSFETVDSVWISPSEALRQSTAGEFDLMRVTEMQLKALAQYDSRQALLDALRGARDFPVGRPTLPPGG